MSVGGDPCKWAKASNHLSDLVPHSHECIGGFGTGLVIALVVRREAEERSLRLEAELLEDPPMIPREVVECWVWDALSNMFATQ